MIISNNAVKNIFNTIYKILSDVFHSFIICFTAFWIMFQYFSIHTTMYRDACTCDVYTLPIIWYSQHKASKPPLWTISLSLVVGCTKKEIYSIVICIVF